MTDKPDTGLEPRPGWRQSLQPWCSHQSQPQNQATGLARGATSEPVAVDEDDNIPTPEDFAPTPKIPAYGFELIPAPGSAWIANTMLAAMVFACMINWSWRGESMRPMVASGESALQNGEYWRLFTALFGHGDVMHLLHNAPIFWFFAWILNAYFGVFVAGILVLLIGVISNWITIWTYDPRMQLLGASGMVYGMVAMWLVLYIRFDRKGWWVKRVVRSLGFSLLVLFPQTYETNVSYMAHASGFVCGLLIAWAWIPFAMKYAPVRHDPYYRWNEYAGS